MTYISDHNETVSEKIDVYLLLLAGASFTQTLDCVYVWIHILCVLFMMLLCLPCFYVTKGSIEPSQNILPSLFWEYIRHCHQFVIYVFPLLCETELKFFSCIY